MSAVIDLAKALISRASITPHDAGCQELIQSHLKALGFHCETISRENVSNLWARYGKSPPLLVFAGHTDVVPPGPLPEWTSPPFQPSIRQNKLYGRGAVDMKGALAAMVVACEQFLAMHPNFPGSIGFLITSDEEGPAIHGTKAIMETLANRQEVIDYCLIGEATSERRLGDQIRVGRRGSFHGKLTIHGKQGHVAFPENSANPIHLAMQPLHALCQHSFDQGDDIFPATSLQITNMQSGTGALNVIPSSLEACFNFRHGTVVSIQELAARTKAILDQYNLRYELTWHSSAEPFVTKKGKLIEVVQQAIHQITQLTTRLSTGGGTSDGRFIAPSGAEVVELGVCYQGAHAIDEAVALDDLIQLTQIYQQILRLLFTSSS